MGGRDGPLASGDGSDLRDGNAAFFDNDDVARCDVIDRGSCVMVKLANAYALHVSHCITPRWLGRVQIRLLRHGPLCDLLAVGDGVVGI